MWPFILTLSLSPLVFGLHGQPPTNRIPGRSSPRNEFPFQVSVQQLGQHQCGGTIIHVNWVLTASHCLTDNWYPYWIVAGVEHYYDRLNPRRQTRNGIRHLHPNYKFNPTSPSKFDIALLQLTKPLIFSEAVSRAALPTGPTDCIRPDEKVFITGWGATVWWRNEPSFDLHYYTSSVVSTQSCHDKGVSLYGSSIVDETVICALNTKVSSCDGDSGGPLLQKRKGRKVLRAGTPKYVVYGVSSFGERPCFLNVHPDVFTNVCYFIDWIKDVMRSAG